MIHHDFGFTFESFPKTKKARLRKANRAFECAKMNYSPADLYIAPATAP